MEEVSEEDLLYCSGAKRPGRLHIRLVGAAIDRPFNRTPVCQTSWFPSIADMRAAFDSDQIYNQGELLLQVDAERRLAVMLATPVCLNCRRIAATGTPFAPKG